MVCDCTSLSYLVDGCSPDIDTSTSDWASQLVTVRRNEGTADMIFDYVLLTFGFDTAVSLTGIEIDLFHCLNMSIGAPHIRVSLNEEYDLSYRTGLTLLRSVVPSESRCDSLSRFTISDITDIVYHVVHIIITFPDSGFMLEKSDSLELVIQVCDIVHGQRLQSVYISFLGNNVHHCILIILHITQQHTQCS